MASSISDTFCGRPKDKFGFLGLPNLISSSCKGPAQKIVRLELSGLGGGAFNMGYNFYGKL